MNIEGSLWGYSEKEINKEFLMKFFKGSPIISGNRAK